MPRQVPDDGGSVPPSQLAAEAARTVVRPIVNLDQATDEVLVRAFIAKHSNAPRVLWQRFSPIVRRIVRRTLGPASDAEDFVQEVFLQLFVKVHTLRDPSVLKAFIISITTLTLRRELRYRKLRSWLGLRPDRLAPDLRVVHPDPIGRAALERFYAVLDRLAVRERTAFALRYIEGLSMNDVASALGVSLATAKRSLAHGQRRVLLHVERDPLLSDYLGVCFSRDSQEVGKGERDVS